jgi:hypothetical protein
VAIAFVGDMHGCALHTLGALVAWPPERRPLLDAVILVGDVGAFRTRAAFDREPGAHYAVDNPAQLDWFRVLDPDDDLRATLARARERLPAPLLFISGNHEEHAWLDGLHGDGPVVTVDPTGLFAHVADGSVLDVAGRQVGALGRIEWVDDRPFALDHAAYQRLWDLGPGAIDILVTHDGPARSARVRALVERLRPRLHVSGHYHHADGPLRYGPTESWQLDQVVAPRANGRRPWKANPHQVIRSGALGVYEIDRDAFHFVTGEWLSEVRGDDLDLASLLDR